MSTPVKCPMCHQPAWSAEAKRRGGIGGRCWRKLAPGQRAAIRKSPSRFRAILARPVAVADDQLPLDEQESS